MKVVISNVLSVYDAPPHAIDWIKQKCTFINPAWQSAVNRKAYTGHLNQNIRLYDDARDGSGKLIECPRGILRPLYDEFKNYGVIVENKRIIPDIKKPITLKPEIIIKDYQEEATKVAVDKTQGIIVSPAGSGKTVMGVNITCKVKTPTLWITHKIELVDQAIERFTQFTDITEEEIGVIGNGKRDIKDLTIATIQTLNNMADDELADLTKRFGCVIVDEVHHAAAETWRLIGLFPAKYRLGLSATP